MRVWVLLLISLAFAVCQDDSFSEESKGAYKIEGALRIPRGSQPSQARILLNGGEYVAIPKADGSFTFQDVPAGTYLLDASHIDYLFEPIRVDVSAKENGRVKAMSVSRRERLSYPLSVKPVQQAQYFQVREEWSIGSMFKNPMMLFLAFGVIMVVVFPRMLNNMDPAELEQLRKTQAEMSPMSLLRNLQNAQQSLPQPQTTNSRNSRN
eukprot:TRINITY_DN2052_c0_g1_i3.p1 TRINITY_DN2052_c0_g1~~TRINITY_DN2052_c0_g1_i3.p1  ORF type:complete len:209 (-),score=64.35 TRINITY_DN2052_c0_g1_i3:43-669(-)